MGRSPSEPVVVLRYGGGQWTIGRGETIEIGRSRHCEIQLPNDDFLSRRMASLEVLDSCVLMRNTSTRKPFVLRPPVGEDRTVEPGGGTTSSPFRTFRIVAAGRYDAAVSIEVDATAITADSGPSDGTTRSPMTVGSPIEFTPAQRRILVELCRPLLTRSGVDARPATDREIGERLGLVPFYVRNVIQSVRRDLVSYGVPDIQPGPPNRANSGPRDHLRWQLARWATRNDVVTVGDVDGLPCDLPCDTGERGRR